MAKTSWALALCLLTTSAAYAQEPREGEFGAEEAPRGGRAERGERGERGGFGRNGEGEGGFGRGGEGGFGRGGENGEEGGRGFGRGGFGGRRGNPLFSALDTDGDGSISKVELRKAVANLAKLDADGDGNITQEEAGGGGPGGPGGPGFGGPGGAMGDSAEMVNQIMTQDKNGDGRLTLDEVDERTARMLQRADQNNDQAIDRNELSTAIDQMRQRFGGGPGGGFGGPGGGGGGFGGRGGDDATQRIMSLDKNGDGKISQDEAPESEQVRGMLRQADANGDGTVDAKEMEQFSRRMGGRMRGATGRDGQAGPLDRFNRGNDADNPAGGRTRRTRDDEQG